MPIPSSVLVLPSFAIKRLFSTYSVPAAIPSPGDQAVNMVSACCHGVYILLEKSEKKKANNKQENVGYQ